MPPARFLLHMAFMSMPRQVLPGQFYMLTRRCTQRQFLLRPDDPTTNAVLYCLAVAAARFAIDILLTMVESNHHHTVIFDRHRRYPEFLRYFHGLVARSQNALRGRWENLWAAQEPCVTRLVDRSAVIDKLIYAATNPVKDGLVERVHHWPGLNGYKALIGDRVLHARRPRHFFRPDGPMPETATLRMTIPPELGSATDVIAELRAGVAAAERSAAEHRKQTGARVLGCRRIRAQSWRGAPTSVEPRRTLRPRFAGPIGPRVTALLAYREFLADYREARARWLNGLPTVFPHGTYWLARFAHVPIASA
jgi:hypothetical protein